MSQPIDITVIHCWSAPRSRSTALLYSFEARDNCIAIDEPLYRPWLQYYMNNMDMDDMGANNHHNSSSNSCSITRPYMNELINGIPHVDTKDDGDDDGVSCKWKRELKSLEERIHEGAVQLCNKYNADYSKESTDSTTCDSNVIFVKHMAKHYFLYNFDKEQSQSQSNVILNHENNRKKYMLSHKHILLIRDPIAILSSWKVATNIHNNQCTSNEVGIIPLLSIYSILSSRHTNNSTFNNNSNGNVVTVLDSDSLIMNPKHTLQLLCNDLHITYTDSMMKWKKGKHSCDGPWAYWWYQDVHQSSGWIVNNTTNNNCDGEDHGGNEHHLSNRKYRTLDPSLMDSLHSSMPAYNYLLSLTYKYKTRVIPPPSSSTATSSQDIYEDPRNEHVIVYIGSPNHGRLLPRSIAGVSPWDSSVQGGDATWEGIRIYNGKVFQLERHLKRLFKSAKALGFENIHTKENIINAIFQTLAVNGMRDGVHMRLTLTRGEKCTSSMNPKFNVYGTTLIILPEWKPIHGGATTYDNQNGISLITSSTRRNSPSTCDSKIHHNNMINNILPKIQANLAKCDDAIMLDIDGFVSETNATNIFMVDDGVLYTPHADHCLPGITREAVLLLAKELGIPVVVRRISLAEFHSADEVFTTGTMGELTPVKMIDGRVIGVDGKRGPVTERLQIAYSSLPERDGFFTDIPPFL